MASRRMCVLVALMLLVSSTALICVKAEDTGATGVTLMATQPGDMDEAYDICWSSDYSYAVVVGWGNADTSRWRYTPSTGAWDALDDYGTTPMYAVDYDQWTGNYIMVGGYTPGSPAAYAGLFGPSSLPTPPAGAAFRDVVVFDQNRFVTVSENGHAYYYWFSGSWFYTEIMGALPDASAMLYSLLYDPGAGTIEALGGDVGGHGKAYRIYVGDLNNGYYYAYADDPPSNYKTFYAADKTPSSSYSLIAGQGQVTKLFQFTAGWTWAREQLMPSPVPMKRNDPVMAWDSNTMRMVMFGGLTENGTYLDDTWEYDVFKRTWAQYTPSPRPSGRNGHAMVWDNNNGYALMFGGYNGSVGSLQDTWAYFPNNHTWQQKSAVSPTGVIFSHAMCFDPYWNQVTVYGGNQVGPTTKMARWSGGMTNAWANVVPGGTPPSVYDHAMAYDWNSGNIVLYGGIGAVGQEGRTYSYSPGTNTWTQRFPGQSPPSRNQHSMVYNYGYGCAMVYGGYLSGTYWDDIWYYDYTGNNWYQLASGCAPLRGAAMATDFMSDMYFFGGAFQTGYNNDLYTYGRYINTTGTGMIFNNTNYTWRGVDWYPTASSPSAVIVGSGGNISYHIYGTSTIVLVENKVSNNILFTVACKPAQSPGYAIAMGGGGGGGVKINQVFTTSTITVNAEAPHISYMQMRDAGGSLVTNSKVNVDSGTSNNYYNIEAGLYYAQGLANFTRIDIWGWRDNGTMGYDMPAALGASFDTNGAENTRFHYQYNITMDSWLQYYPSHAEEWESWSYGPPGSYYSVFNSTYVEFSFRWMPRKQFRYAPGPTIWNESAGTRYNANATNGQETLNALNDPNTWDLKMTLTLTDGRNVSAYDEFGVFKYTYIGAGDVPATISGSGPPGGTVAMSPVQDVSFMSNCNYSLKVYMDSLLRGVNDANRTMPASALGVMGGDLQNWTVPGTQAHFNGTGSANALYFFAANGTFRAPEARFVSTTTSVGSVGTVRWRCIIPMGTAEDRYTTTVTFMLEHD